MLMDYEIIINPDDQTNNLLITTEGHRILGTTSELLDWLQDNSYQPQSAVDNLLSTEQDS